MSVWNTLFGGGVASVVDAVAGAADSLITSDEERGRLEIERRKVALEEARLRDRSAERQTEINKIEAAHPSVVVAGWRPAAGWCSVLGMFYHFLVFPIAGPIVHAEWGIELYDLDWQELAFILGSMLGVGVLRSRDKRAGVDTHKITWKTPR